jgi:hypothetical protein
MNNDIFYLKHDFADQDIFHFFANVIFMLIQAFVVKYSSHVNTIKFL